MPLRLAPADPLREGRGGVRPGGARNQHRGMASTSSASTASLGGRIRNSMDPYTPTAPDRRFSLGSWSAETCDPRRPQRDVQNVLSSPGPTSAGREAQNRKVNPGPPSAIKFNAQLPTERPSPHLPVLRRKDTTPRIVATQESAKGSTISNLASPSPSSGKCITTNCARASSLLRTIAVAEVMAKTASTIEVHPTLFILSGSPSHLPYVHLCEEGRGGVRQPAPRDGMDFFRKHRFAGFA